MTISARFFRCHVTIAAMLLSGACGGEKVKQQATTSDADSTAARDSLVTAFAAPENLVYDSASDVILVTNINGDPAQKDGNGFVSRISGDWRNVQLKWIDGLDAPKGIILRGDTVFIADVNAVRLFDRQTGKALAVRQVKGGGLNDLVFDNTGTLYVTDTGPERTPTVKPDTSKDIDAVYRFDGVQAHAIAHGTQLQRPDGIAFDGTSIIVAPLGGNTLYRVDKAGKRTNLLPLANGQLDGLWRMHDGRLLVTSWEGKCIFLVDGDSVTTLMSDIDSPAGVGIDTRRDRLLVSSFNDNRLYSRPMPQPKTKPD
jgi:sugar lactone lactonase YvrE